MSKLFYKRQSSIKKDFTEIELQDLRTAFELMDENNDGRLTSMELQLMLEKLGIHVDENILQDLVKCASHSGHELINETEFLQWVKRIQELKPDADDIADEHQKNLMAAFMVFDIDQNGFITKDELKKAMDIIGEPVTEEHITEFLTMADTDQDGKINYEEFARLLK